MLKIWIFDCIENDHDVHRGKGYIKKFCKYLQERTMKIINIEKNKKIPLTNEKCKC